MRPRRNFRPQRGKRTPEGGKGFARQSREEGNEGTTRNPRSFRPGRGAPNQGRKNEGPSDKPAPREGLSPQQEGKRGRSKPGLFANRRAGSSFSTRTSRPEEPSRKPHPPGKFKQEGDRRERQRPGFFEKRRTKDSKPYSRARFGERKPQRTSGPSLEGSGLIRLNKFIANSGVCSRREADNLIAMGLITVNGATITEMGYKVKPGDEIRYESKILKTEKPVYVLLNKPKGFLTTTDDPQERKTVMSLVAKAARERIYPVGRLDRNTTGLLLLTNDGDLADKLSHPSYEVKKIYKVELDKPMTRADFDRVLEGVHLEEGKARVDDFAVISDDRKTVGLEIHIGWNRVVRRIFESLGYVVVKLDRSVYAGLDKKDLARGQWRYLRPDEVIRLKHFSN